MIGLHLITVDDDAVIVSVMEWSGVLPSWRREML